MLTLLYYCLFKHHDDDDDDKLFLCTQFFSDKINNSHIDCTFECAREKKFLKPIIYQPNLCDIVGEVL